MRRKRVFQLKLSVLIFIIHFATPTFAQKKAKATLRYNAIHSGTPWFDDQGNAVNAHGGCIVSDKGKYYLFGECHSDTSNAFVAFNCYSSRDLMNWKFERQVLKVQPGGPLGPNRIGERAKVMKCTRTGEYVMYMHTDDIKYKDPKIGYATCSTISGDYTFQGALPYNNGTINKWDMGTFQDTDGKGYILIHEGSIYALSDDYHSVTAQIVKDISPGAESPAIVKVDSTYFWLASNKTAWERNDNFYHTATSMRGPWTSRGKFTPEEKLTWNSQTTFVLPIGGTYGTTYMYMGDRWSYPRQGSAATYVWQPLTVNGTTLSIPIFNSDWLVNLSTGRWSTHELTGTSLDDTAYGKEINQLNYSGQWIHTASDSYGHTETTSDSTGAVVTIKFKGTQIRLYGVASPDGGYGKLEIVDRHNNTILSSTIDFYSKYHNAELKFVSPILKEEAYTMKLTVMGTHSSWSDKARHIYGSTKNFVSIDRIVIH